MVADDPHIGHSIGQKLQLSRWAPIAAAARDADSIGDLLRRFVINALEHSSSTEFFVKTQGERTTFGFTRIITPPFPPAQNDAFYVGFFCKTLRQATDRQWDPAQVLAVVADPRAIPSGIDYPRVAKGDHSGMSISFPTSWQFLIFRKSAFTIQDDAIGDRSVPESLLDAVHTAIYPHVHEFDLDVTRAASICGYGKRQLSRMLRDQGTTIVKEVAAVRATCARNELAGSNTRIAKIGESVGFKDPTVFSRAFKNWTGQSPQEYRRNNRI